MRIHIVQKSIDNTDLKPFLAEAQSEKVDLVCFGELALSGCLYDGGEGVPLQTVLDLLSDFPIPIMVGFPDRQGDHMFNSYLYHTPGENHIYNKVNLFPPMNEPDVYRPGRDPLVVKTDHGKYGFSICYDLRFEDHFKKLKEQGAEFVFVPAAWPNIRINDWRELLIKRAVDNNYYVLGINAVGDDGTNLFGGTSMVVDPVGNILAEADQKTPTVLKVEI